MKQKNALQWLSIVAGKTKLLVGVLVAIQAVLSVSSIAFAFVLRRIINMAVDGARGGFWASLALLVGILLGQIMLSAAGRFLSEYTGATVENRFKHRLFSALLTGDYASVAAVHSGEWMNRLTSDTTVVADTMAQVLPGAAGMLVRLIAAAAVLLYIEPRLAAVILPAGAVLALLATVFRRTLKRLHKQIQESDGRLRVYLQESLSSLLVVRIFDRRRAVSREADARMDAHRADRMRRTRFSNLCNVGFSGAMYGFMLFGVIYCGSGILHGTMSYGAFAAVQQLITQIQGPFANLTGYLPRFYAMLASADRLREAESFPDDLTAEPVSPDEVQRFYRQELLAFGLRDACFTYPGRGTEGVPPLPVASHLDLTVEKGCYLALTGHSGCGKSTLLKLLMALYPLDSGQCFLLGRSGEQPLTSSWRGLFSYVPQGSQLLSGTVRQIVAFSDAPAAQDEPRIRQALRIACAEDFVDALEQGLDTPLGERGAGLSEGQLQRLAIARAVFSDRPVLLLDEATSALDEATEAQLLANLRQMTDKTVLIVTHRPAALAIVDRTVELASA